MKQISSLFNIAKKVYLVLTKEQRKESIVAFCAMLIASVFELLGVSLILPLIMVVLEPNALTENILIIDVCNVLHIEESYDLLVLLSSFIVVVYFMKGSLLVIARYIQDKFCRTINKDFQAKMMRSYLCKEYEFFINTNGSEIMRGVENDTLSFYNILMELFTLAAETITILLIGIYAFATNIHITLLLAIFGIMGVGLSMLVSKRLLGATGEKEREAIGEKNKAILQIVDGIKDIFVKQKREFFFNKYLIASEKQKRATLRADVVYQIPERIIEFTIVTGIIVIVVVEMAYGSAPNQLIAQLSVLGVACFRLLPSFNKVIKAFNRIGYYYPGFENVCETIMGIECDDSSFFGTFDITGVSHLEGLNSIEARDVTWSYMGSTQMVLDGTSVVINNGETIAIVGKSGSGKTTLADVILGLLKPRSGDVLINGISIFSKPFEWATRVAYVPQDVFLLDDTIRSNITFGIDLREVDDQKVWRALEAAQLKEFVYGLPLGLDTTVGDNGIKFSGGQRQRIALARALYSDSEVLILDEATSALDNETEEAIIKSVEKLKGKKTMIIIAHRLSTIRNCDRVYEIVEGKAIEREKDRILANI